MTVPSQPQALLFDEAELRSFIENALSAYRRTPVHIATLERRLYDYHSSFAIEELSVRFADNTQQQFILKNLSPNALLPSVREIRPQFAFDALREVMVYRDILAGADLGTATCFGTLIEPSRDLYCLLLEKVVGDELYKVDEFSVWCNVCRWLARMHSRLAEVAQQEQGGAHLLMYNEAFCNTWIDRAEQFASHADHSARWGIEPRQMKWLATQCRIAVRQVIRLPVTFIHGEFYASNILVEQHGDHIRVCPIDWETAAIGTGVIDLAALVAGNWTEAQKEKLATAYYEELSSSQQMLGDCPDLATALRYCGLLLAIKWLGWSPQWQPPAEHRKDWLTEATQLAQEID